MPNEKHTKTYKETSELLGDIAKDARGIEKKATALAAQAENLMAKAEEEKTMKELKRKIQDN